MSTSQSHAHTERSRRSSCPESPRRSKASASVAASAALAPEPAKAAPLAPAPAVKSASAPAPATSPAYGGLNRLRPQDKDLIELPLAEDELFRGLIFAINRMQVRLPSKRVEGRDILRHPGAVAIVALTDDGNIVLVRQWRAALGRITLEIPAGKLEPGEDAAACARRELREETGVIPQKLEHLTSIAPAPGYSDELIHLFMATQLSFKDPDPDEDEFIHVELVPLSRLIDDVLDGRIEDAKTIIGALICDAVSHRLSPTAPTQEKEQ